ncbi:hypothetical protein MJO52_07530 [Microbulbifer variabilis]|uniref:Uncharacterized protein n=1 Tax=Microbulbifer variabilis TaxID=266805 RepID=A0ABY4VFC4_9GAMM|nr:hypothetical protein [Microbulbifer variabilis]USD22978.1 hypothetical protein MJO52_07530 [Microbulbifer variabilis]
MGKLPFLRFTIGRESKSPSVIFMPSSFYFIAGLATIFAIAGIFSLYSAWLRSGSQPLRRWSGWGLLLLSAFAWSAVVGVEYGVSIATLLAMLAALTLLVSKGDWPSGPPRKEKQRSGGAASNEALLQLWLRGVLRFLAIALLPTASGLLAGLLYFGFTGFGESARLVGGAFVAVIVWTLAMVWCSADKKLLRPSAALVVFSLASGFAVMPAA